MGGLFGGLAGKAKLAGAAIGVGLGAAAVGSAVGLFKLGDSFGAFVDTIQVGTGATGAALDDLVGSFKNVSTEVPDQMGTVASALADLNTRTGLTGPALEGLTEQFLDLSRITKTDVGSNIREVTRLFGDWGVATEDQGDRLDFLYRVSQATGIGVDSLSGKMVQFGAPLRQLGFSLEESATLLGQFEKEGVNAELVMGSFRIALGKMARDGEPAQETLARVTEEIANAGSSSEANALALELFGARAGPDMAAAIREGRFAVGDLVDTLANGEGTIASATEGIDKGLAETFGRLRNKITVALEPLATRLVDFLENDVFPVIEQLADRLPGMIDSISAFLEPIVDTIGTVARAFRVLLGDDGPQGFGEIMDNLLGNSGKYVGLFRSIGEIVLKVADFVGENLKPILLGLAGVFALLVAPVASIAAGLVFAYLKFEGFRNVVDAVVRFLTTTVLPAIVTFATMVAEQFGNLVAWVQEHWDSIREAIEHVVNVISGIVSGFVDAVLLVWSYFGDTILAVISTAWDNVKAVVEFAVDFVSGIIEAGLAIINGEWGAAWDAIVGILSGAWELVKTVLGNALEVVKTLIGDGLGAAKDLVSGALDEIVGFFSGIAGRISRAAGDVFGFLWESFKGALNLVIRGWNRLEFKIPGFDPPGPGPKFGGFTLGLPNIPELAEGGDVTRAGLAIVGEDGAELLDLNAGARVTPLDVLEELAGSALGRGDGPLIGHLEVPTAVDATADEVVDAIGVKLGWKLTTRKDR
jgi:phage-related minor tail protein